MNLHLPQSFMARNELKRIANVKDNIISAKNSVTQIKPQQDAVAGSYLLTTAENDIPYGTACNILSRVSSKKKYDIKKTKSVTGHELFSYIIPDGINIYKKGKFKIEDGIFKKGVLNKKTLTSSNESILNYIWERYGVNKTTDFINDSQRLILEYLYYQGLTIGFQDCIINDDATEKMNKIMNTKLLEMENYITEMENDINDVSPDIIENTISSTLNTIATNMLSLINKNLDNSNNLYKFVNSGSKGSEMNLLQMMGFLGQIMIKNKRIKKSVNKRTLPMFHKDDDTPTARGFIKSNFLNGLSPPEFFFHISAGRVGLIATAISTAKTGYIQRRLVKALEDLYVHYDGTVRTAKGVIIQRLYGENGFDQLMQVDLEIPLIRYSNNDIVTNLLLTKDEIKTLASKTKTTDKEIKSIESKLYDEYVKMRDELRSIYQESTYNYKTLPDTFKSPVNLNRLTQDHSNKKCKYNLKPKYIIDEIEKLVLDNDIKLILSSKNIEDEMGIKFLFRLSLYTYLSPKKCVFEYKMDKENFDNLLRETKELYIRSIVNVGEMVGNISAQSIGEPTSQMTLDVKHSAGKGGSSDSAQRGVPRIEELLTNNKNIKTPQMVVYFDESISQDRNIINKINSHFKYLTISELINSVEILYDSKSNNDIDKLIASDKVTNPFFINNEKTDIDNLPFIFRIVFNIEKMMAKETTILDIKTKIISHWYNITNNKKIVGKIEKEIEKLVSKMAVLGGDNIIHIRFNMTEYNMNILNNFLNVVLNCISLKGVDNITDTDINEERRITFDKETGEEKLEKENVIVTSGINIDKLLDFKGIDHTRSYCNHVREIYRYYGIEAVKSLLLFEFRATFNAGGGKDINYSHLSVLIDFMTHTGSIVSIERDGLGKLNVDPIAKASFEKTVQQFRDSALYNKIDYLQSTASKLALGKVVNGGTGAFRLIMDLDKIMNSEFTLNKSSTRSDVIPLETEPIILDILKYGINETNFYMPN